MFYHSGVCRDGVGDVSNSACLDNGTERQITNVFSRLSALVTQRHNLYADTMSYDKSGNMAFYHLGANTPTRMWFTMAAGSNRLVKDSTGGQTFAVQQSYDLDGAETLRRPSDSTPTLSILWRWYYYDGALVG